MGVITSVAITGAAGFVGAHLARGFDARSARVLRLVRAVTDTSPAGTLEPPDGAGRSVTARGD